MENLGVTVKPGESLHVDESLLRLINILEYVLHLDLAECLELLLMFGLSLFNLFNLLFFRKFNFIERFLHCFHNFICHPIVRFRNFLLQLFTNLPVLLRMLMRHLVELSFDLRGLRPEFLYEFKLDYCFVGLWQLLNKLVNLFLGIL
jgi:hypothetical protein